MQIIKKFYEDKSILVSDDIGGDTHNLGYYVDQTALTTAHATANDGDFAIVGSTDSVWVWDSGTNAWVDTGETAMGDVVGPASSTDNAIARYDSTTGKLLQNSTVTLTDIGGIENVDNIKFDLTPTTEATVEGEMKWNATEGTVNIGMPGGNVSMSVGQEMYIPRRCRNATGSDMPNGYIVYINGVSGNRPTIIGADADSEATSTKTIGMTTEAITNGNNGYVTTFGVVRDVDTNAHSVGDALWLSSTTGGYTSTRPAAPKHAVFIGYVLKKGTTDGEIFVNIQNGYELDELHDVLIGTKAVGDFLKWDGTTWINSPHLSWSTSGHTGSNLGAPLFDSTGIATQVVPTALQSIRINAGGTAWEAYTPSSGVSWGTSINGATGTGLALALDNSYAAGGIGQSITIGNTQTQALTALKIDTGTSTVAHTGLLVNAFNANTGFSGITIDRSTTSTGCGLKIIGGTGTSLDAPGILFSASNKNFGSSLISTGSTSLDTTSSSSSFRQIFISTIDNGNSLSNKTDNVNVFATTRFSTRTSGTTADNFINFQVYRENDQNGSGGTLTAAGSVMTLQNSSSQVAGTLTDTVTVLKLLQTAISTGSAIDITIPSTSSAKTNGVIYMSLNNTQSVAHVMQKIDLGTSAQGHKGLLIAANNASSSINAIEIGMSTTGTGTAIEIPTFGLGDVFNAYGAAVGNVSRIFSVFVSQSGSVEARTNDVAQIQISKTNTAAVSKTDNFNVALISRTNAVNNAGGTLIAQGSVLKLENVATQTAGTLTDSVTPLLIVQDADSTGVPIKITQAAVVSTNFKKIIEGDGITIWKSDGTTPSGALSGTAGDICLNGPSGQTFYCQTGTTWTGM